MKKRWAGLKSEVESNSGYHQKWAELKRVEFKVGLYYKNFLKSGRGLRKDIIYKHQFHHIMKFSNFLTLNIFIRKCAQILHCVKTLLYL
jgi:hypothetical protein